MFTKKYILLNFSIFDICNNCKIHIHGQGTSQPNLIIVAIARICPAESAWQSVEKANIIAITWIA